LPHQTSAGSHASSRALTFSVSELLKWLLTRTFGSRRRGRRYRMLSPAYAKQQHIADRHTGERFAFTIRDRVDLAVVRQIFHAEDYRLSRLRVHHDLLRQYQEMCTAGITPLIVDLGANTGLASFYLSREFPKARIIAVEPDRDNAALARQNNRGNPLFDLVDAGISSVDGHGTITNTGDENWAYRTELTSTGDLAMVSMNTLFERYTEPGTQPFIIKIDIEGFESDLFARATEWVDQYPLLIIELHDWMLPGSANSASFLRCISQRDRDFVYHAENVFSIRNG
jgi:FkbM family methyltransferase